MKIKALLGISFVYLVFGSGCSATPAGPTEERSQLILFDQQSVSNVLTLPSGEVRGVALILPGSGNVGADGDVSGPIFGQGYHGQAAPLSKQIANTLAQSGFASLRYAKRGFETPSELPHQTIPYLTRDALSAWNALTRRFPGSKRIVVGVSEGAVVGTLLSEQTSVDSLFLLGFPARSIEDTMNYQYLQWPTELIAKTMDSNQDGILSPDERARFPLAKTPILQRDFSTFDLNKTGFISIQKEILPAYQQYFEIVQNLLKSPPYAAWSIISGRGTVGRPNR